MEPVPHGAIWVKNFKLRQSISNFISTRSVECPKCKSHFQDNLSESDEVELNDTIVNHVMTVKVKALREKFIAIFNPRKSVSTHPDYFLYVYQAYTGANSVYPFAPNSTNTTHGTVASNPGPQSTCTPPSYTTNLTGSVGGSV